MSIYSRLFRYSARKNREPLEDFLTEAFCDLMRRMPKESVVKFLNYAFKDATKRMDWSWLNTGDATWRTQVCVPNGIADAVLYFENDPVLVIESKTWSGFQDHSTENETADQLTTYSKWLSANNSNPLRCGMLLITGTTMSPAGYHSDGPYAIECRSQITWASSSRWLESQILVAQNDPNVWAELAKDLIFFLKEKKLSSEIFTSSDLSAVHLMLPAMNRWRSTFQILWDGAGDSGKLFQARTSELLFHRSGGVLWQYRNAKPTFAPAGCYIALGLRFPEYCQWFQNLNLPDQPQFIALISSDKEKLSSKIALPDGWLYAEDEGEFITVREVSAFSESPDQRIDELQLWSHKAISDAEIILSNCVIM